AEIRRETDHLKRVLEDFLLFARPGTARATEVALEGVVRRAAADPALEGAAVELHRLSADIPSLLGDEQLLEHAFRNLLRNAVRAQSESGRDDPIIVELGRDAETLFVRIEDRGAGLPEEIGERLFQPFVSGFRGGVGLGLAVSHRIVTLHGGRLRLLNRTGGGARAEVVFPTGGFVTNRNE
ncbi:MAG: hypothetical protein KDD47_16240, partial [Acidobacteria bacterium]|nr:hypothetical protein [Acidobacteriota bacterium]